MDRRILRLARSLRAAGVPASTAEAVDAAAAALAVGVERRDDLRTALQAALVKEAAHLADFAAAFDREFPAGVPRPARQGRAGRGKGGRGPRPSSGSGHGGSPAPDGGGAASGLPAFDLAGERSGETPAETAAQGAGSAAADTPRGPARAIPGRGGEEPREGDGGPGRFLPSEEPPRPGLTAAERRAALGKGFRERWERGEEERAVAAMEELAERLAARLARRRARARRGALDVRATLRANLRHGGVPFTIVRRRRRPGRPDLVLLADVSGSVRVAAGLFLRILARLRGRFAGVRAFAYTDRPAEIDVRAARGGAGEVARAVAAALPLDALSDHGEVLRRFNRDHGGAVRGGTVLVVLGDGRNNRAPAQEWELEAIRRRARRVVWIVPERSALHGGGDSAMPRYAPHCDLVLAAPTPAALGAAAGALLGALSRGRGRWRRGTFPRRNGSSPQGPGLACRGGRD